MGYQWPSVVATSSPSPGLGVVGTLSTLGLGWSCIIAVDDTGGGDECHQCQRMRTLLVSAQWGYSPVLDSVTWPVHVPTGTWKNFKVL